MTPADIVTLPSCSNTTAAHAGAVIVSGSYGGKCNAINVIAGTTSAASAPIGDSRALYERGILSRLTSAAERAGASIGMKLKTFVERLLAT